MAIGVGGALSAGIHSQLDGAIPEVAGKEAIADQTVTGDWTAGVVSLMVRRRVRPGGGELAKVRVVWAPSPMYERRPAVPPVVS